MKVKIQVWEKVTFEHDVTVEVPEGADMETLLDNAAKGDGLDDVTYTLEKAGCKVLNIVRDESGMNCEIEIPDYEEVEDEVGEIE
jgi:hypothetical protein